MAILTPAGTLLAAEIEKLGPIPFSRFMEVALYHPEVGYYRRSRDPFGRSGDFYTAEQLQPVFGRLIARYLHNLRDSFGLANPATLVELGAGRAEMREALAGFRYVPVDFDYGVMPAQFEGIVFSNEFFDAIPVDVAVARDNELVERRVDFNGERFVWTEQIGAGELREIQHQRLAWVDRIDRHLQRGLIVTIDYGYTRRELVRFPQGTLMSYKDHYADEDVLAEAGYRDITAHVAFTDLQEHGESLGWTTVSFETLGHMLLRIGEDDEFESALAGNDEQERTRHRGQLKSLLFGMGQTFRVLVQRKG